MVSPPGASVPYCQHGILGKPPRGGATEPDWTLIGGDQRSARCLPGTSLWWGTFGIGTGKRTLPRGPLHLRASSGLRILPGGSCRSEPETRCRQRVGAYQSNPHRGFRRRHDAGRVGEEGAGGASGGPQRERDRADLAGRAAIFQWIFFRASRSMAFCTLVASARSMIACMYSPVSASPFATAKCRLSRMVRRASISFPNCTQGRVAGRGILRNHGRNNNSPATRKQPVRWKRNPTGSVKPSGCNVHSGKS
jgi:hypothetical protein